MMKNLKNDLTNVSDNAPEKKFKCVVRIVQEYINEHYDLRYNVLSRQVELNGKPMTKRDERDIVLSVMDVLNNLRNVKTITSSLLESSYIPPFNPVDDFLKSLPVWDGKDHVADLVHRIPKITDQQTAWIRIWLRGVVSQWREGNELYGNQCVLTFIGKQGSRKSTFLKMLLPESLRRYYLDKINMSNAFSRDMALTNNLLVNIDEMDQIKAGQQAELKFAISRSEVNGRPIYGKQQERRKRYASFAATTNNPHPLQDVTGSRRFICVQIPAGKIIDIETPIDYAQLYAQILNELDEQHLRSWFTDEEVAELQIYNEQFQATSNIETMLDVCFRKPAEKEQFTPVTLKDITKIITTQFPNVVKNKLTDIQMGLYLKQQGYKRTHTRKGNVYEVVPLVA